MMVAEARNNLSYVEFEVLQLLVTQQGQNANQITNILFSLPTGEVSNAINNLLQKKLVDAVHNRLVVTPEALTALSPYKVKRAVILAAGRGERLTPETNWLPKPMVKVQTKRIIETQLDALAAAGINDITIVRGYRAGVFDELLSDYPHIKFIENPDWESSEGIASAAKAINLLSNAYLIEGDLFIRDKRVLRSYEYRSSYCGTLGAIQNDWYFTVGDSHKIQSLLFGSSTSVDYKFVGIMYWNSEDAKQLKKDLKNILDNPKNKHRFIESVPFHTESSSYSIYARQIRSDDVTEIDHLYELEALRLREKYNIAESVINSN